MPWGKVGRGGPEREERQGKETEKVKELSPAGSEDDVRSLAMRHLSA